MRQIFADTDYWRAIFDKTDGLHSRAKLLEKSLTLPYKIVTSEMVLTEFLNNYADEDQRIRVSAHRTVEAIRKNANITVVPQTPLQFAEALRRYGEYPDKEWSHTDCASMLIMRQQHIKEALTPDHHFRQAGFTVLL